MLNSPQGVKEIAERPASPKKPLSHRMTEWFYGRLTSFTQEAQATWEYVLENHSNAIVVAPFALNGAAGSYVLALGLMGASMAETEYTMNCYYTPVEEQGDSTQLCKMASWFGAPTHEDYKEKIEAAVSKEQTQRIPALQKDCKDAVGRWITEPQDIGIGSRIECEDSNGDGVPEAVHYTGTGQDMSYSIHTGERLPRH